MADRVIWVLQLPQRKHWWRPSSWDTPWQDGPVFKTLEAAERAGGDDWKTVVRERGGSTDIVERHTARKDGKPMWRILGVTVYEYEPVPLDDPAGHQEPT